MSDENVNIDIEKSSRNVKNSDEAAEIVKDIEKLIQRNKCSILWLAYQHGKILKDLKSTINL